MVYLFIRNYQLSACVEDLKTTVDALSDNQVTSMRLHTASSYESNKMLELVTDMHAALMDAGIFNRNPSAPTVECTPYQYYGIGPTSKKAKNGHKKRRAGIGRAK